VRRGGLVGLAAVLTMLTAACTAGPAAGLPAPSAPAPSPAHSVTTDGFQVPATYLQACADEGGVCTGTGPPGPIPAALSRPLHFPALRPGARCPVSKSTQVNTTYFGGTAYGPGPVRVLINSTTLIDPTSEPPWLGLKTTWFSPPAYRGPFVVRAERLGVAGPAHLLDGSTAAPLVVPPGPTINGGGGWREAPGGFWVRSPGCYAFQVDGLTFSYDIVVRAVLASS
jgi:hypothetical protein